jgi:vancomycin resistance protein VanW
MTPELRPIPRSPLRIRLGKWAYTSAKYAEWWLGRVRFARDHSLADLPYRLFDHKTPLIRKLAHTEMWLQYNKIINLRAAILHLDGLLVRPGETFSYWRTMGKPSKSRGFVDGMVLFYGQVRTGVGGGLCQLSNLIYWMTLHTPLTVTERHRHSYDVFPDAGRTQPFGSGATCAYNYLDLRIENRTEHTYRLRLWLDNEYLHGSWQSTSASRYRYEVKEKDHRITSEPWGGYVRHNSLWRDVYDKDGRWLDEEWVTDNRSLMMYSPLLDDIGDSK